MKTLVICLLASAACVHGRSERELAAGVTDVVDGSLADDGPAPSVYQPVSSTTGGVTQFGTDSNWTVTFIYATIETSTNASYEYVYTSKNGTSRFNVTAQLRRTSGSAANPQILARIQTQACDQATLQSNYLLDNSTQPLASLQILSASPQQVFDIGSRNLTNSTVYNLLVDYDKAQSVGLYANGNLLACRNMDSPFPDFPNDWSATIENTDSIKGRTFVLEEQYSQKLGKVRLDLHGFGQNRILLTDTADSSMTFINPANGSCSSRPTRRTNWITGSDNITLLSTSELLHFSKDQFKYVPGIYTIRNISCELWQANVTLNERWVNASFIASFYFPVNQWLVNRESYHRLLKQASMNGTWNGTAMSWTVSYVNFRPRTFRGPTFDVCAISPYGSNCNCTDALRRAAFSNITDVDGADSDDFSTSGDLQAACKYGASVPHGFISAQSGPYVGLTIIGMIGGSLITGIAMYLFYRKRVGVTITDTLGHQKFNTFPSST